MQQTPHACPHCRQPLWLRRDMWGPYYLCDDCGWTAEDDSKVIAKAAATAVVLGLTDPAQAAPTTREARP